MNMVSVLLCIIAVSYTHLILRYVRVEFAGYPFQKDKEINGITFGSVGSGTTIDHLQAVSYTHLPVGTRTVNGHT